MRRHSRWIVLVLPLLALAALVTGAAATPGPGGWDNLGTGASLNSAALNGAVYALNSDVPGVLYVGGAFTAAGGKAGADYIAKWSSGAWSALGSSKLNGAVHAIAYHGGKVYVGGVFTNAGGNPDADFLAVWDGTKWGTPCNATGPAFGGNVNALQIIGSTLYVGGSFANGAGIPSADYLLACNLNTGAASSPFKADGDLSGAISALTADSKGTLYIGGGFSNLEGMPAADDIAYYAAGTWHAMGSGAAPSGGAIEGFVRSLAASGTTVYAGTDSVDVTGIPQADHVVKWDGSAWSAVGAGSGGGNGWFPTSSFIYALATSGSNVFAGGSFQNADGDPLADFIAWFDGKTWHPVGSDGAGDGPMLGTVLALTTSSQKLIAGGNFTSAGGNTLAGSVASFALSGLAAGGGGGGGGGSTPTTGTAVGTVLVNGKPFTKGQIPYKSKIDVTHGTLVLTTDTGTMRLFGAGVFSEFQLLRGTDSKKPIVELRLIGGDFSVCKRKTNSALATAPKKVVRQLWGNGKGHFRTRGRYAAATVRGTNWLTQDRCDGTLTRVKRGVIQVSDFPAKKQVTVRAGKSYLATP